MELRQLQNALREKDPTTKVGKDGLIQGYAKSIEITPAWFARFLCCFAHEIFK